MKKCMVVMLAACAQIALARTVENFNADWTFEQEGKNPCAVALPHDWAIAGPFDARLNGNTGSLPWKGKGVYRKRIVLDKVPEGRVFLEFDGVMARATVFVNDYPCGHGDYGYLGFAAEATPYLRAGTNEIRVAADTLLLSSRWYPGGGIYRDVRMVMTDKVHLEGESLKMKTSGVLTSQATAEISGLVTSRMIVPTEAKVEAVLTDPSGKIAAQSETSFVVGACRNAAFTLKMAVDNPQLWQLEDNAKLYTLELRLTGEEFADSITRRIGLREFRFDAGEGFFLNGRRVQLKGVDLHSDLGPLGMAFDRDAMRRQLTIMRDMGVNALRTSHNPPAPQVLDLCDEMGIFVWDECFDKWNETCGRGDIPLEEFVPRQLKKLVRRDRMHPSVFIWSIGNEISVGKAMPPGQESWNVAEASGTSAERCAAFRAAVLEEDDTRSVAIGSCFTQAADRGDLDPLDVVGWNYESKYMQPHLRNPRQPMLYSESASTLSEYGVYEMPIPTNKLHYLTATEEVSSYDMNAAPWSDIPDREFAYMERDRFCAGEFVWTGIDYLGEPTPYQPKKGKDWRSRSSYFGVCDLCALPKDRFYLYRSHWNHDDFTLHIVPHHWNFPDREGKKMPVFVYTSADEVELFVNGKTLGKRRKNPSAGVAGDKRDYYSVMPRYRLMWNDVPYEPGEIKAVVYAKDGAELGTQVLRTAGNAARIVLTPERTYGDLCVVVVTLADKDGTPIPDDNRRISFEIDGGMILAVGNSNPRGFESFKDVSGHSLCRGRAAVYVRMEKGRAVRLNASADGLPCATATLGADEN